MGYVTWHYSLVSFQSPISASIGRISQLFLCSHPTFLSATFPHKLSFLVQEMYFLAFPGCVWVSLALLLANSLMPCQAQRCLPIHELLLNLGHLQKSMAELWICQMTNFSSFSSIYWTAASVRCCQGMLSEPLLLLKWSVQTPGRATLQRPLQWWVVIQSEQFPACAVVLCTEPMFSHVCMLP